MVQKEIKLCRGFSSYPRLFKSSIENEISAVVELSYKSKKLGSERA